MSFTICCPTLFGLEGIVADELRFDGKLDTVRAENGRVFFEGNADTLAWANLNLRCAERVLLRLGAFPARSFDELYENVRALPLEDFIPKNGGFPVKGFCLDSRLHSVPDCQKIVKKAAAERLGSVYGLSWLEENGEKYQLQFSIMKDAAEIFLDTTGAGLHKRGYRKNSNAAPLRETLAAAIVKLSRWKGREALCDPFCGSGTIAIEAAMTARKRAPGLLRSFDSEKWQCFDKNVWHNAREQALSLQNSEAFEITGSDVDPGCVKLSYENAIKAGVSDTVRFESGDAAEKDYSGTGVVFANPPYGERLLDIKAAEKLYESFGKAVGGSSAKQYILSPDPLFESLYGKKADKRRKLYNGMIKCNLYMYFKHSRRASAKSPNRGQAVFTKNS